MPANASMGTRSKLAIGLAEPPDTILNLRSGSIPKDQSIINTEGLRGTRSAILERQRLGTYTVGGTVVLEPVPEELDLILRLLTGTAKNGANQFPLAEELPEFFAWTQLVAQVHKANRCKINRATFEASEGGILQLTLDIQGGDESVAAAGTFPALDIGCTNPYVFMDATLTLRGIVRQMKTVRIDFFNDILLDRFMNTSSRTQMPPQDRVITLACTVPYTVDELDLYNMPITGVVGKVDFFNDVSPAGGGYRLTFDFANLVFPARTPPVPGRGEIVLELEGRAYKGCAPASVDEVVITNVSIAGV